MKITYSRAQFPQYAVESAAGVSRTPATCHRHTWIRPRPLAPGDRTISDQSPTTPQSWHQGRTLLID